MQHKTHGCRPNTDLTASGLLSITTNYPWTPHTGSFPALKQQSLAIHAQSNLIFCTNSPTTSNSSLGKKIQPEALFIWSLVKQPQRHKAGGFAACFLNQKRKAVKGWTVAHPTYQHHPISVLVKYHELSWAWFQFDHWAHNFPTVYSPRCFFQVTASCLRGEECLMALRMTCGPEAQFYRKDLVWNQKISSIHKYLGLYI